jgi:putative SOS response-associated peptidase YedK
LKSPDDTWLASATIITTDDGPDMHEIHNRMPVVLEQATWDEWWTRASTTPTYCWTFCRHHRRAHWSTTG